MQLGFPFLFHQRLHCGFHVATKLNSLGEKSWACASGTLGTISMNDNVAWAVKLIWKSCVWELFIWEPVLFFSEIRLDTCHSLSRSESCGSNGFQPHSKWVPAFTTIFFSFRIWESPVPHLYVTEDHSKCSFKLSAGGGPRHLCGRWRRLSWSPQITRTMDQMIADKLWRVGWPEKREGEQTCCQIPSLLLRIWRKWKSSIYYVPTSKEFYLLTYLFIGTRLNQALYF